uniref:C-type lectin domain-containing protein n=2 Tax=Maylandia zebra TaxID=106582 RepID=A0A3P9BRN6_9CICH
VKVKHKATEQTPDTNNLKRNQTKLTLQMNNLTQVITVLEKNVTNLTAENQNLRGKNEELEAEKKNLTDQIQNMTTSWNELNVSRAQWSIDAYCPKTNNNRMCKICQTGWLPFQSGCYAINNPEASEQQKTWKGAQDDCIGKISDLAVVNNETEKSYISDNSWDSSGNKGYWIGLRVKDGNWKWVDGRNLTKSAWIPGSPTDGQCAISVTNQGFKSVSCSEQNRWICKKKALTL